MTMQNEALKRVIGQPEKLQIDWVVSNICNYDCSYCGSESKSGSHGWPSLPEIETTLEQIKNHYNRDEYIYTLLGGELTLWKHFDTFIDLIHSVTPNNNIKLLTNGRMPAWYWADNGKKFGAIQFSYHAANTNDLKFIESVRSCSCPNINVFVMMDPAHWDKCVDMFMSLTQLENVRNIQAKPLDNRATDYESQLYHYSQVQIEWMKTAFWSNRNIRIPPVIRTVVEFEDGTIVEKEPNHLILNNMTQWQGWKCAIGVEKLSFAVDGRITRGTACDVGDTLGDWRTGVINELPNEWAICPKAACFCGSDISVSKHGYK